MRGGRLPQPDPLRPKVVPLQRGQLAAVEVLGDLLGPIFDLGPAALAT